MHVDVSALVGPLACIGRTSARAVDREIGFFQRNKNKGLVSFFLRRQRIITSRLAVLVHENTHSWNPVVDGRRGNVGAT